jgi:uncharacterized protein YuzE
MYPCITYDEQNGLAYITFTGNEIERTVESKDELLAFDIDKNGNLVGIEILSVLRLLQSSIVKDLPLDQK